MKARLKIFDREETISVPKGAQEVVFNLRLPKAGVTQLEAWFDDAAGESQGAYYVYVERL